MKKRLISLFLAFDMLLSLFPISAFAETPSEQPVKVYHAQDLQGLLIAVQAINLNGGNNTISLEDDITLENGKEIKLTRGETTILGNNHTISGGESQTLWVSGSAVLNLGRQDGTDKLTFEGNGQSITAVSVSDQAKLNVYEGVTIENYHNSGVKVGAGAAFTMNGGTIQNCSANDGGGVKVDAGATFTMSGGTIQNCSADDGGGVAVCGERNGNIQKVTPAVFTMSGGTILHCTAMGEGGGVAADYAEVTISGGSIKNCSAVLQGGGINFEDGTLSMSGGSIENCSAVQGGGIALLNTAADLHLTLTGGSITNNRADNGSGGGICVMSLGNFSADAVENMTITGNSASRGGGVYGLIQSVVVVDLSDASNILCNNTAKDAGADVCMDYGSIKLPDAALMNRNLGTTGHKIDGWYIDGIKADTAGYEVPCDRYTPNEHGEAQDVTAVVSGPLGLVASYKRVRHTITVTAPDSSYGAEAKNAEGSKAESALEGEHIYLSYDDTALKENETFEKWIATDANGNPVEIKQDAAGSYFVMPESDVTVVLSIRSADVEPDVPVEPSEDSGAAGSIIAGAVICAAGYYIGTELYLETVFGDVPANRQALASALWEKAGRPEPESTALYTDVDAQDADAQKADRWCVEQRLIPDRGEDTFRPAGWVTHAECIVSWKKLEKMLKSAVK